MASRVADGDAVDLLEHLVGVATLCMVGDCSRAAGLFWGVQPDVGTAVATVSEHGYLDTPAVGGVKPIGEVVLAKKAPRRE